MDHPKKKAIIDACLTEFSEHGYERANTNRIGAEAGVSKGLIFHYFGSKNNLFLLTVEACMKEIAEQFEGYSVKGQDFIQAMLNVSTIKLRFFKEHPRHYRLLMEAFYNSPPTLAAKIKAIQAEASKTGYNLVREMMGELALKPGVDRGKALDLILSVSYVIESKFMPALSEQSVFPETVYKNIETEYMEYLKLLLYGIAEESGSDREAFHE